METRGFDLLLCELLLPAAGADVLSTWLECLSADPIEYEMDSLANNFQ